MTGLGKEARRRAWEEKGEAGRDSLHKPTTWGLYLLLVIRKEEAAAACSLLNHEDKLNKQTHVLLFKHGAGDRFYYPILTQTHTQNLRAGDKQNNYYLQLTNPFRGKDRDLTIRKPDSKWPLDGG